MKRLISGAGAGIVEDWIRKGVLIPAGKRTTRTSNAAQRVKVYREFGSCYYFIKGRSSQSRLLSYYSPFLSQKQRSIIRDTTCTKDARPIDKVNIMIKSGRYTIYVDFHIFPWFDNGTTALCKITVAWTLLLQPKINKFSNI